VILACVIKVVVQIEIGRYAISTGRTTMEGFNEIPGPRLMGTSWLVWWWFGMFVATTFQAAGIVSAVGQCLHQSFGNCRLPFGLYATVTEQGSVRGWTLLVAISGIALLLRGKYGMVQSVTTVLVFLFTLGTIANVALVQSTEFAISARNVWDGLSFQLPQVDNALLVAFGVFGVTGVGASELVYYPYWCLEKGYARFAGPNDDSPDWTRRAKGWVRVLHADAWLAMVVYTLATVAFYLLGAATLHGHGDVPEKDRLIATLSQMYTATLGNIGLVTFLIGAFVVLYSTFFVATASLARVLADFSHVVGRFSFRDQAHRANWISVYVVLLPVAYCTIATVISDRPKWLVTIGAIGQALTLPPIAAAAIYLRYTRTDRRITPRPLTDLMLWVTAVGMWIVGGYKVWDSVKDRIG
jgi:Mn2+/Fe2+ NRAMP family transporter